MFYLIQNTIPAKDGGVLKPKDPKILFFFLIYS